MAICLETEYLETAYYDVYPINDFKYRNKNIITDNLIAGNVFQCYDHIERKIVTNMNNKHFYIGSSVNPASRFKNHISKWRPESMQMNLLYTTPRMLDCGNMEHMLLKRFLNNPSCLNKSYVSSGLVYGKYVYYVYQLVIKFK